MVLSLSAFWITVFLFLDKCLKALNSDAAKFSDGLWSLEKLSFEDRAVSSNLAQVKSSCFTSRNSNSRVSKNSECSIDLGFTEKLRPLHNTLLSLQIHTRINRVMKKNLPTAISALYSRVSAS